MMIKVTSPQEKTSGLAKLEEAVNKFEKQFLLEDGDKEYYHLVIVGEYNRAVCDEIVKIYTEAGWDDVKCRTSSENGERGRLTGLRMYRK